MFQLREQMVFDESYISANDEDDEDNDPDWHYKSPVPKQRISSANESRRTFGVSKF